MFNSIVATFRSMFLSATFIFVICLLLSSSTTLSLEEGKKNLRRSLQKKDPSEFKRIWDVCPSKNFPVLHAILHERRSDLREHYEKTMGGFIYRYNGGEFGIGSDALPIQTIAGGNPKYAIYRSKEQEHYWMGQSSAWNDEGEVVLSNTQLVKPLAEEWKKYREVVKLSGNYVAYSGWFYGNLGHFIHDNLPNIAYLKALVPETTKFILGYDELHARILEFIDPIFYERIFWIQRDSHIVEITDGGNLTVTTTSSPNYGGCCEQFDPLRRWMAEAHPEVPAKKVIIFYTRSDKETGKKNEDNKHGRVLNPETERIILNQIRKKLKLIGRKEEIVVFDGKENGKTMSIEKQFQLFRSAVAIIGPHGSGLGGNFIWTNPFLSSCNDRVQILEFLPGKESAHVQALHASYFMQYRKWPFEYHQILYNNASTPHVTDIDLHNLDDALEAMFGSKRIRTANIETSAYELPDSLTYYENRKKAKTGNLDKRLTMNVV